MYTRHIISIFNPIWTFIFVFKRTLTSVKLFFSLFMTPIINFLQMICIAIRVRKCWCFMICGTYFLCYYNLIHCIVNNDVVSFLPVNPPPGYGDAPADLSRPNIILLSSEVSQDLTFFWRMYGAVDETVFWFYHRDIYMPFSALAIALTLLGVSPLQGGFSYIFSAVNRMVGVFPGRFL